MRTSEKTSPGNRQIRVTALAAILLLTLGACAVAPNEATPFPSETVIASPTRNMKAPSVTTNSSAPVYPVGKTCDEIMSLQALYDFNPNFTYDSSQSPPSSSHASKIVAIDGISCTYLNLSSGSKIVLALAKLDKSGLAFAKEMLAAEDGKEATSVSSPVIISFFNISNGEGTQDILTNEYWVSASSASFFSPEDAANFLKSVLVSLS